MKFIKEDERYSQGYVSGDGLIKTTTYSCPCGKGTIDIVKDEIPGFKSIDILIHCESCQNKLVNKKCMNSLKNWVC